MNLRRNILIFHTGALGDFVITWPLALALGRLFAQSRVIYVTHASKGQLAERILKVESVDADAGWHQLYSESPALADRHLRLLRGAQAVFSFGGIPGDRWSGNIASVTDAPITYIDTSECAAAPGTHVTEAIAQQLSSPLADGVRQIVRSIHARGVGYQRKPGSVVVIHPGAGSPDKCWPLARFMEVILHLQKQGKAVRVLVGEVEQHRWPKADLASLTACAALRTPATYLELLAELASADRFIGNDSGPTHLAAIIGVPTVSIFGTDPARWRPIGPSVCVQRGDALSDVTVAQVLAGLKSLVST